MNLYRMSARPRARSTHGSARRALLAALLSWPLVALADYPDRLIRVIIPYPALSAVDSVGRGLFTRLQASLGQLVIVDNRVGANGNVGMAAAARAPKDGYRLAP